MAALLGTGCTGGVREHQGEWPYAVDLTGIVVQFFGARKQRQQVDDVVRRVGMNVDTLVADDGIDRGPKVVQQVGDWDYPVMAAFRLHRRGPSSTIALSLYIACVNKTL